MTTVSAADSKTNWTACLERERASAGELSGGKGTGAGSLVVLLAWKTAATQHITASTCSGGRAGVLQDDPGSDLPPALSRPVCDSAENAELAISRLIMARDSSIAP